MYLVNFLKFLIPKKTQVPLGRWNLKHDMYKCNNYIQNYYGEPGYQNTLKSAWIENTLQNNDNSKSTKTQ